MVTPARSVPHGGQKRGEFDKFLALNIHNRSVHGGHGDHNGGQTCMLLFTEDTVPIFW